MPEEVAIALMFQDLLARKQLDAALALTHEDLIYEGGDGKPLDRTGLRAMFDHVLPMIDGVMHMELIGTTHEGERVALEMKGSAKIINGNTYANRYHFLFVVRGGKILQITEYCDTTAVSAFS